MPITATAVVPLGGYCKVDSDCNRYKCIGNKCGGGFDTVTAIPCTNCGVSSGGGSSSVACNAGYYVTGTTCSACGTGTYQPYSNSTATSCSACTNGPANSVYESSAALTENKCPWHCKQNYYYNYNIFTGASCPACPDNGYTEAAGATSNSACKKDYSSSDYKGYYKYSCYYVDDHYDSNYAGAARDCTDNVYTSCKTGYYLSGTSCEPCTNKPSNSSYTGSGGTTNSCPWQCNGGYHKNGNLCSECGIGNYCPAKSASPTACTSYRPNTSTTTATASSTSDCLCIAGRYWNGSTCTECPYGTYKDTVDNSSTSCISCPVPNKDNEWSSGFPSHYYAGGSNLSIITRTLTSWVTGITSISNCRVTTRYKNDAGEFMTDATYYNTLTKKYDSNPDKTYYQILNPGYYLTDRYVDDYCDAEYKNSWGRIYQYISRCPEGKWCPGYDDSNYPKCGQSVDVYGNTLQSYRQMSLLGMFDCPANATCSGGRILCSTGWYLNSGKNGCAQCVAGYPNSATGAAAITECYSNTKSRSWTGKSICPATPAGCVSSSCGVCRLSACNYVAYSNSTGTGDGTLKSGCATNNANCTASIISVVADNDHYANGTSCPACPNGWRSPRGATEVGDCGRVLAYQPKGASAPTRIYLRSGTKKTSPSLAAMIDGHVFYANMTPVSTTLSGNMYVGYDNAVYRIYDDTPASGVFNVTTMPDTDYFKFTMGAIGNFIVNWGDGTVDEITGEGEYEHVYEVPGEYIISFDGRATEYRSVEEGWGAIGFAYNENLAGISGSLGALFPTIDDGSEYGQPTFLQTFEGCYNLTGPIPEDLFKGIYGKPTYMMFYRTFADCENLTGEIPQGLFGDISGAPAYSMFYGTFYNCTNLTGPTARTVDGTRLYDVVNPATGQTWWDEMPSAFDGMYDGSDINPDD